MNIQDWFSLGLTGLISCSPWDSQEFSPKPQFKSISFLALRFPCGPTLTSIHDYWKNHQIRPDQSLSSVRLFATPWIPARQASLSMTNSQSLLKLMSIESILRKINPEYSLEGMMLKLKLQYFGHLMQRADSLKKTLMLGKIEGKRRRRCQRMRWLGSITDSMDMSVSKLW